MITTEGITQVLRHAEHFLSPQRLDQLQTKLVENHARSAVKGTSSEIDDEEYLELDVMGFLLELESYTELSPKEQLLFMAAHLLDVHYLLVGSIKATDKQLQLQLDQDQTEDVFLLHKRAELVKAQVELTVVTSILVKYAQIEEYTPENQLASESETFALMTESIINFCNDLLAIINRQPEIKVETR